MDASWHVNVQCYLMLKSLEPSLIYICDTKRIHTHIHPFMLLSCSISRLCHLTFTFSIFMYTCEPCSRCHVSWLHTKISWAYVVPIEILVPIEITSMPLLLLVILWASMSFYSCSMLLWGFRMLPLHFVGNYGHGPWGRMIFASLHWLLMRMLIWDILFTK